MAPQDKAADAGEGEKGAPSERREFKRVFVEIPGSVFVPASEKEAACRITNISPSGAEIACPLEQLLDTPIVLYASGLGRFEGQVVWQRDDHYGVRFTVSERKQAKLAGQLARIDESQSEQPRDTRNNERIKTGRQTTFTRGDGSVVSCTLLDFSTTGVLVKANVRPDIGEFLLIGEMAGRVVRYSETGIAIEFIDRERDEAKFRKALAALDRWRTRDEALSRGRD